MSGKFPLDDSLVCREQRNAPALQNRKRKSGRWSVTPAALTSMLTGITEPLEFTFLFVAPLL
ncbi:MAG: PTS transporter subunit EIIC [Eubacterium ramulus]